jgi:group I intron endonuclease
MNKPGIYSITHEASGKVYVGSSLNIRRRWNKHRRELRQGAHHSQKLQRAWDKYGADAFVFAVIEETDDLLPREQHWLDLHDAAGAKGYNVSPIAGLIQAPGKRRPHSEATKAKIRAARATQTAVVSAMHAANTGHARSPEARAAISAGKKGRTFFDAHRVAIAAARTGTTTSAETRAKQSTALKAHHAAKKAAQ